MCAFQAPDAEAANGTAHVEPATPPRIVVEPYFPPDPGPYPQDKPPENTVRFTPVQVRILLLCCPVSAVLQSRCVLRALGCRCQGQLCLSASPAPF